MEQDHRATEPPADNAPEQVPKRGPEGRPGQKPGEAPGPRGNPEVDEESLRKKQEEAGREQQEHG